MSENSDEKQHLNTINEKIKSYEKVLINEIPLDLE
jgi:hypothetical protein